MTCCKRVRQKCQRRIAQAIVLALVGAAPVAAQQEPRVAVSEIAPRYHLLSEPAGNLVLYTGDDVSLVAGVHSPTLVARARELVRSLNARPVRWALLMESDSAPNYGDGGWGADGTVTFAHEMLYVRMRNAKRLATNGTGANTFHNALPGMGFSRVVQLFLQNEEPHVVHDRAGATNADVIVHFEEAGILMLGDIFHSDGYPTIDRARGGNVTGLLKWVDWFSDNFDAPKLEPIVPGRGPVATLTDLRAYRTMLTTVRDRVLAARDSGQSVEAVVATRPTAEFDARWGRGPVSPDAFVRMIYETLPRR